MTSLALAAISKSFGPTIALDAVSLDVQAGEIHALLGENGAGKSTLMRIAYGLESPDSGRIVVDSERGTANRERLGSPREARSLGIGMVHQHFTSIPALSVAENIALAAGWRETGRRAAVRAREVIARLALPLEATTITADLSVQLRQRLEIVQALAAEAMVLLLDEPTAVLAPREVAELMALLRRLADHGTAVVLITHKLREVTSVANRVTVLRAGRRTATGPAAGFDLSTLSRAMIGEDQLTANREPLATSSRRPSSPGRALVELTVHGRETTLRAGEVIGIAAIEGNGERELLGSLAGLHQPPPAVVVRLHGTVALIPEDRTTEALAGEFTLTENLALGMLDRLPRWIDWHALDREAARLVANYDVRARGVAETAATLSGGNQQKFVLARALARRPEIVVAVNPTRGLDIRATAAIHDRLRGAADEGACVVVHSSDVDEVLALADRVLVMHEGHLAELPPTTSRAAVGDAMLGLPPGER